MKDNKFGYANTLGNILAVGEGKSSIASSMMTQTINTPEDQFPIYLEEYEPQFINDKVLTQQDAIRTENYPHALDLSITEYTEFFNALLRYIDYHTGTIVYVQLSNPESLQGIPRGFVKAIANIPYEYRPYIRYYSPDDHYNMSIVNVVRSINETAKQCWELRRKLLPVSREGNRYTI